MGIKGIKGIKHLVVVAAISLLAVACGSSPAANDAGGSATGEGDGHGHGAAPPPPAPLRNGERFQEIGLERPYQPTPPQGGTDEYRCFLIDPKLTEATYLTGTQFLPQNAEIVHHAILYRVAPAQVVRAKNLDARTEGDGWQCFGGPGISDGAGRGDGGGDSWIGAWAPGNNETLIGELAGYPVEPGTHIVLQVHYNLLATDGKPGPTDQSTVRLRMISGTADVTPLHTMLATAPIELPCTPAESGPLCDRTAAIEDLVKRTGVQARQTVQALDAWCNKGKDPVPGPTQHCDLPIQKPALLYAVAPHLHLLGRSISVELNPGTPGARKLLDQPVYNFDDQSSQPLPQPVTLNPGDTIRITCTHDAALRSQLPQLKILKPRYVVWGDGTSDEMCLAMLIATNKV
ncbi:MAG TPA: hypothetical protein VGX25_26190 [Actinophytocola sp.]|uniref:monooxygenase n=1 Tax=Actinophytocola sp. TaxID=1872138 RepID=UPI002DDC9EF7|nr:hypothetical protein [Actinophytocola sp.]HEV2782893.1 hypothetical protein [Actinophytocola sp.]